MPRRNFYDLRRTFRTIADEVGDDHAVDRIMGHTIHGMGGVYLQRVAHRRLEAVSNHVRRWLMG